MKTALLLLLAMMFAPDKSNGQEYFLIGSKSDCSVTGENPLEWKYKCNNYLNVRNGFPECSAISESDPSALWEVTLYVEASVEFGEPVAYFVIKNKLTGKYLNIDGGLIQCSEMNADNHKAQWAVFDTDFYFHYWFVNRETNQSMVFENGVLRTETVDNYTSDRSDRVWYYFTPDKLAGSGGDPVAGITDPTANSNTTGEAQSILERHNYWRAQLGIAPLAWSDELATYAQQWANELSSRGCQLEHRPRDGQWKQLYGENLYWAMGGNLAGSDAVESWAAERKDFDHNTQEGTGGVVGHYTQMIWENTTKVGCAKVVCSDGSVLWVCNYDPPGNWSGEKPYRKK